jgi:tRNA uridine 5-carboxymethylaminomethyl modification enzyme
MKRALILRRDEAYIGVLIDDELLGTEEPYRMFTQQSTERYCVRIMPISD